MQLKMASMVEKMLHLVNLMMILWVAVWSLLLSTLQLFLDTKRATVKRNTGDDISESTTSNLPFNKNREQFMISLIIATKNESRYIGKFLRNLEVSTLNKSQVEVIIIDVESKDNTIEVAKASSGAIPVRYIRKSDSDGGGRGTAFNEGYARSSGDMLLFLRADSLVPPGTVAHHLCHYNIQSNILTLLQPFKDGMLFYVKNCPIHMSCWPVFDLLLIVPLCHLPSYHQDYGY